VSHRATLEAKIARRDALVGVVGLGYVGLPLALAFTEGGFRVLGYDVDEAKISMLRAGRSYLDHIAAERLATALEVTSEAGRLREPDAILICVPTPLTPQQTPDMRYVEGTAATVARTLRPGQLVVLESTSYPGTTDELVRAVLEGSGLRVGEDLFLAYSPEREDPGRVSHSTRTIPKVVGGVDEPSAALAELLYGQVIHRTVRVSSARVAEAAKLTENVFRAVNIALVNELKIIFERMGIDVWEVLDAAATKPFGFMRFDPGPGLGGHCIPLDPFYLAWKAREHGVSTRFIELAGEINRQMPAYVVSRLERGLNARGKPVRGSRVLVLGIAYKKNVSDPRESPAFEVLHQLLGLGAVIAYHDPHVPAAPRMRSWPTLPELCSQPLTAELLRAQDAVIVITNHDAVDYALVAEHAALVVDTRGVYREARANVLKA
jgi:UDP-N-acetyl-D-glucosamine dehydrogenase